jgi:hypothetical protein
MTRLEIENSLNELNSFVLNGGVRDYTQVSIQEWKDGKIIRETFVYAN